MSKTPFSFSRSRLPFVLLHRSVAFLLSITTIREFVSQVAVGKEARAPFNRPRHVRRLFFLFSTRAPWKRTGPLDRSASSVSLSPTGFSSRDQPGPVVFFFFFSRRKRVTRFSQKAQAAACLPVFFFSFFFSTILPKLNRSRPILDCFDSIEIIYTRFFRILS